jgi:hypothetical protein
MNKTISKAKLDAAIKSARYWHDLSVPYEEKSVDAHYAVCKDAAMSGDLYEFCFPGFFSALFGYKSLKDDATNEDIYKVLEVLGWSVIEEDSDE